MRSAVASVAQGYDVAESVSATKGQRHNVMIFNTLIGSAVYAGCTDKVLKCGAVAKFYVFLAKVFGTHRYSPFLKFGVYQEGLFMLGLLLGLTPPTNNTWKTPARMLYTRQTCFLLCFCGCMHTVNCIRFQNNSICETLLKRCL